MINIAFYGNIDLNIFLNKCVFAKYTDHVPPYTTKMNINQLKKYIKMIITKKLNYKIIHHFYHTKVK